jgi:hypothetical protein
LKIRVFNFWQNASGVKVEAGIYQLNDPKLKGKGAYIVDNGHGAYVQDDYIDLDPDYVNVDGLNIESSVYEEISVIRDDLNKLVWFAQYLGIETVDETLVEDGGLFDRFYLAKNKYGSMVEPYGINPNEVALHYAQQTDDYFDVTADMVKQYISEFLDTDDLPFADESAIESAIEIEYTTPARDLIYESGLVFEAVDSYFIAQGNKKVGVADVRDYIATLD